MATGQTILDTMEVLFPEFRLQSGEADVTKGLVAANRAQDLFETHAAQYPDILGGAVSTVSTTNNQEYTTYPAGLMRLDGLDFINPTTSRVDYSLRPMRRRGGHAGMGWYWSLVSSSSTGQPRYYWTDGTRIYWNPIPGGTHTIRYYGFAAAADISASGTFAYPDAVILPIAVVATKIWRSGLDDGVTALESLAIDSFNPVLDQMSQFRRDTPPQYEYQQVHDV